MKLKSSLCLLVLLVFCVIANGQDSTSWFKKPKIDFDFGCGDYFEWPAISYPYNPQQFVVPKLLSVRRPFDPNLQRYWDLNNNLVTTSPLNHNAFYFDLKTHLKLDSLAITVHLVAEHRGASAGVYSPDVMDVYPK